uniref:Uncharacterized protein n=1 Tax=Panagrolaimus sp. JU765 TaxID=591449 RepID=A0AC34R2T3_9BILA
MANVQDFDEMISKKQQYVQELEESLRKMKVVGNPGDHATRRKIKTMEKKLLKKKTNVLKLQSQKNRLLNPVSLCPDLYFDVLVNAIASQSSVSGVKKINIFEYAKVGEEGVAAVCQLLKKAERLTLSNSICFGFSSLRIGQYFLDARLAPQIALENFIRNAAPNLSFVEFNYGSEKYSDAFFDALSKESNQTILEIHNLPKVNDITKLALENLAQKKVLVSKFERFFSVISRIFSTTTKLTVDFNDTNYFYYGFEASIVEIKESMKKATQKEINMNLCIRTDVTDKLIQLLNGRKIGDKTYEWKPESDEKKVLKFIFDDYDYDDHEYDDLDYGYSYSSSSSDDVYYDS